MDVGVGQHPHLGYSCTRINTDQQIYIYKDPLMFRRKLNFRFFRVYTMSESLTMRLNSGHAVYLPTRTAVCT